MQSYKIKKAVCTTKYCRP